LFERKGLNKSGKTEWLTPPEIIEANIGLMLQLV